MIQARRRRHRRIAERRQAERRERKAELPVLVDRRHADRRTGEDRRVMVRRASD